MFRNVHRIECWLWRTTYITNFSLENWSSIRIHSKSFSSTLSDSTALSLECFERQRYPSCVWREASLLSETTLATSNAVMHIEACMHPLRFQTRDVAICIAHSCSLHVPPNIPSIERISRECPWHANDTRNEIHICGTAIHVGCGDYCWIYFVIDNVDVSLENSNNLDPSW